MVRPALPTIGMTNWSDELNAVLDDLRDELDGHPLVTVVDGTGINFTLAGQQITAEPIFGGDGGAGTVSRSDHSHVNPGITIKDDGVSIDADITTIDFLAPLTVSESPENEINVDVDVGTGAAQVAAGNHTHAQLHDAVTVVDGTGINFTLATQQITAEPIFAGTGSAGTVARSDHTHDTKVDDFTQYLGLTATFGNGVDAILTSEPMVIIEIPETCTLIRTSIERIGGSAGNVRIQTARAAAGSTTYTAIDGSLPIELAAASLTTLTTLTGWNTAMTQYDKLALSIDGAVTPTILRARISLTFSKARS